jgi:hypothetical protein
MIQRMIPLVLFTFLALSPGAKPQAQDLDAAQREAIARRIYALVQQYFAHWEGAP